MKNLRTILLLSVLLTATTANAEVACFEVQGMTCVTCSLTLKSAVKRLKGINDVKASVENKNAIVHFDPKQTTAAAIKKAIDDVGYNATPKVCQKD